MSNRILSIIGSPQTKKSNTRALVDDFLENLASTGVGSIESETCMLGTKHIEFCRGCWRCTQTGECVIKDDLPEIQTKLLASDMLIFGSPVYIQMISAQMKVLFDRLFLWLHTVRLIGKPALTAVTTAKTGLKSTENYLKNMMSCMGAVIFGSLRGIAFRPGEFPEREKAKDRSRKLAEEAAKILSGEKKLRPTFKNQWYFTGMKKKAQHAKEQLPFEYDYWVKKGWMNLSYRQALKLEQESKS